MKKKFWQKKLKHFLIKHPFFEDLEYEKIYTPKEGLKIKFWIEGNLQIEGIYEEIEINFNDPDLLIVSFNKFRGSVFRVIWKKLIAVEFIPINEEDEEIRDLLRINPEQSN